MNAESVKARLKKLAVEEGQTMQDKLVKRYFRISFL